jgi:hypothetical protein
MLVPIYLGLCPAADANRAHEAGGALINANLSMAVLVSVVHSLTMIAAGGVLAWLVCRYLDVRLVSRSWFNLDATWAFSSYWWALARLRSVWRAGSESARGAGLDPADFARSSADPKIRWPGPEGQLRVDGDQSPVGWR